MNSETYTLAELVRQKVRRARALNSETRELVKPGIDASLLADERDGTVFSAVLTDASKDLVISIEAWPLLVSTPPGFFDVLEIYHTSASGTSTLLSSDEYTGADIDKFPLSVTISKDHIGSWVDGLQVFSYKVRPFNGSAASDSDPLSLIFDRTPPYGNKTPDELPALGYDVTDANIDSVSVELPSYDTHAPGDKVYVYWLNHVPEDPSKVTPVVTEVVDTLPKTLQVPADEIKAVGDGGVYVLYVLVDKAGNISRLSMPTPVGVAVGPLPSGLQDPVVPLAADSLIDQEDAWAGVVVEVPSFDNWKSTDWVQTKWGTLELGWREIGSAPKFPLEFLVQPRQLWDQYGASSTGEVVTNVSYELRRGTVPQGSRNIDVNVNLEAIGPTDPGTDPEWPDPVNPKLALAEIFGKVSNTLNTLLPEDEKQAATLKVVMDAAFKEGDIVSFYWDDVHVTESDYSLVAADLGAEISVEIPWDYIEERNNGSVPVHYRVERPGVPNRPKSRSTLVNVEAIVLRPDAPAFLGGNTTPPEGWLTCGALYDDDNPSPLDPAIRVVIKDLGGYGLKAGDTLTLHWYAVHNLSGEEKIDDTVFDDPIVLTEADLVELVWRVQPYDDYILPIYNYHATIHYGRGRVYYSFDLDGKPVNSDVAEQVVAMHDAAGSCPLRP